ncbi:MAG: autotransporter assembly complex family protein [Pseudomonadota bacterium]
MSWILSNLKKYCFLGLLVGFGELMPVVVEARYLVEIEAIDTLKPLLNEHLNIVRYQDRTDINEDQFKFLIATLPDQIKQLVSTEGYFSPKINVQTSLDGDKKQVHITVNEGKRVKVSGVYLNLEGEVEQEKPPRIDRVRQYWRLPVGQPFRQADWDDAKNRVLLSLQRKRYLAAKIDASEAQIDPVNSEAELGVDYDSGPVFKLGALRIKGLQRYPALIVEHMNPLQVGEEYDEERLLELQRQVQSVPYFSNVQVSVVNDPLQAKAAPVEVKVTEYPAQRFQGGVGFASDAGTRVEGHYSNLNMFKRAWVLGGDIKLEQRRQFEQIELAMPPGSTGFINSGHVSYDRTTLEGVDLRSMRLGLQRARSLEKYKLAYALDYYSDDLDKKDDAQLPPESFISPGRHRALVPNFTWSRRDVDNPVFPRKGNIISVQGGFGLQSVLSDETFLRFYSRIRHYHSITRRDLVVLRGEAGGVLSRREDTHVPASLLFRAGGTDSVRGYSYQSIGNKQNGTVYPVKYLLTGGTEYQHWLSADWGGAVFYDVGLATNRWQDKTLYHGVGTGVRWRSPVGPVNVDLAYALKDRKFRPHISLGVAF